MRLVLFIASPLIALQVVTKRDIYQYNQIPKPTQCPGDSEEGCSSTKFAMLDASTETVRNSCIDYQEIKVQEQVTKLSLGSMPQSITAILQGPLVDSVKPGQHVMISAFVIQRWRRGIDNERCDVQLALLANHVDVLGLGNEKGSKTVVDQSIFSEFWDLYGKAPIKGRDLIVGSFSPNVYGMHMIKLALLLALIGGTPPSKSQDTPSTRSQCHILLIGDPGTAKSQLLKSAAHLSPRAVFTTSTGSSTAGLAVSLSKDASFNGEWTLEPGALVLADGGVCCIDEFGRCKSQDMSVLHEAMELGTVSVAKAGVVCKLSSRCSVFAATNPKSQQKKSKSYDGGGGYTQRSYSRGSDVSNGESVDICAGIGSPLLSRFDLILAVLDTNDPERDVQVSNFILNEQVFGSSNETQQLVYSQQDEFKFDYDMLASYISMVKTINAVMTDSAAVILKKYYAIQRQTDSTIASSTTAKQPRTTIRLLESLVRLSQAHARMLCRESVTVQDAVCAILVHEASILGCLGISPDSLLDSGPADPDNSYYMFEWKVLEKLDCLEFVSSSAATGAADDALGDLNFELEELKQGCTAPDNVQVDTGQDTVQTGNEESDSSEEEVEYSWKPTQKKNSTLVKPSSTGRSSVGGLVGASGVTPVVPIGLLGASNPVQSQFQSIGFGAGPMSMDLAKDALDIDEDEFDLFTPDG